MRKIIIVSSFIFFITNVVISQTTIQGIVKDENGVLIENVTITCKEVEVTSDYAGAYAFEIPLEKAVKITFSHPSFQTYSRRIRIRKNRITLFSPKLTSNLASLF